MKKRTGRRQLAILVSLFGLLGQPAVNAAEPGRSAETEREVLARVIDELRAIKALVAKADQRKLSGTRVSFDYSQLLAELSVVSEGIEEYISGTRLQPRTFEPLGAHYTEVKTQSTEGAKP